MSRDESPVPDSSRRTLRIPDGDRYWIAVGATCQINECYAIDIGYTHIFQDDVSIDETALAPPNGVFVGEAEGSVDIVAVGVHGSF